MFNPVKVLTLDSCKMSHKAMIRHVKKKKSFAKALRHDTYVYVQAGYLRLNSILQTFTVLQSI